MIAFLLSLVVAYLLGSLSGSLLLGRVIGVDIRTRGSGNAGGTNAFRTLGWRFALGVVAIDIGKGALAAAVGLWLHDPRLDYPALGSGLACVLAAAIGHTWPLFFGFRGGKGAGTLAGGLLLLWPACVPPLLAVWLGVLTLSGYVGLSTICAALALVGLALTGEAGPAHGARLVFALAACAFIVYTHRANVRRLWRGEEHRFERVRVWARLLRRRVP